MPAGNPNIGKLATSWKPGQSGNPSGKPKSDAEIQRLFRQAIFEKGPKRARSLADEAIDLAHDRRNPKRQMEAMKIVFAYGLGMPRKSLSDDSIQALAEEMMQQMLEQARQRRAEASVKAAEEAPIDLVATVTVKSEP